MTCNCIEEMDKTLAEHNTKLCVTFGFPRDGGSPYALPALMTEKINKRDRRSVLAIPTFCPFCGTRYREPEPETAQS